MKLLYDQNISRRLVKELEDAFPGSSHVFLLGLHNAPDEEVWDYAREHGFSIVTQDSDFYERSLLRGIPPKVIWLRTGNTSTRHIMQLLLQYRDEILSFGDTESLGCLEIY